MDWNMEAAKISISLEQAVSISTSSTQDTKTHSTKLEIDSAELDKESKQLLMRSEYNWWFYNCFWKNCDHIFTMLYKKYDQD